MKTEKSKKVIWHLSSNRWNSAITEYALSCIQACKTLGHKQVFSPLENSFAHNRAKEYGIENTPFESFNFDARKKFIEIYKNLNPDIIFVYEGKEHVLAQLFTNSSKTKIIRFKGRDIHSLKKESYLRSFFSNIHTSFTLVPAHVIKRNMDTKHSKVIVVPLGINTEKFKRPKNIERQNELLIFGRIDPIKGHREFLSIYKQFLDRLSPADFPTLHIAGLEENIGKEEILTVAKELQINTNYIKFTIEKVAQPSHLLASATLGIIPSLGSEVICRVAQEFLVAGTPILTSGVGALEEVQLSGVYSYKNKSPLDAVDMLLQCYQVSKSENESSRMLRSADAQEKFSFLQMGKEISQYL